MSTKLSVTYGALAYMTEHMKFLFLDDNATSHATHDEMPAPALKNMVRAKVAEALEKNLGFDCSEKRDRVCYDETLPVVGIAFLTSLKDIQDHPACSTTLTESLMYSMQQAGISTTQLPQDETQIDLKPRNPLRRFMNGKMGRLHLNEAVDNLPKTITDVTSWYENYSDRVDNNSQYTNKKYSKTIS